MPLLSLCFKRPSLIFLTLLDINKELIFLTLLQLVSFVPHITPKDPIAHIPGPSVGQGSVFPDIAPVFLYGTYNILLTSQCGTIHKLDVEKKEFTAHWEDPKCRATEPQFVPK